MLVRKLGVAAMYSPTLGRFMQTDPIGYGDGMNMYRYVGDDPVNGVDPSGLYCLDDPYVPGTGTHLCGIDQSMFNSYILGGTYPSVGSYGDNGGYYGGSASGGGGGSVGQHSGGANGNAGDEAGNESAIVVNAPSPPQFFSSPFIGGGFSGGVFEQASYGVPPQSDPLGDFTKDIIVTARTVTLKALSRRGSGKGEWIVQPLASRDAVWYELKLLLGGVEENPREGVWVLKVTPNTRVTYRSSTQGGGRTLEFRGPYLKQGNPGYLKFRFSY